MKWRIKRTFLPWSMVLTLTVGLHEALPQEPGLPQITPTLFRSYHTNLFVKSGQNRGFTRHLLIDRVPAFQHDLARNYIYYSLLRLGLQTRLQPFSFITRFGDGPPYSYTGCNNIVALLPGMDPARYGTYIVSAFYDTLDQGQPLPTNLALGPAPKSPGADLNASGVAGVLCAAHALAGQRFLANIYFILFDASEKNFAGAFTFVSKKTTSNPARTNKLFRGSIRFMISLDTIGYNPRGSGYNTAMAWGGSSVPSLNRRKLGKALLTYGGLQLVQGGTHLSSDHVPFHEIGIDCCVLSERHIWTNPYIYTANDSTAKADYIDYTYASDMARGVAGFLAKYAVPARQLTLTKVGGGSVDGPSGWVKRGSTIQLTARPYAGWTFSRWSGDTADCTVNGNVITVPMTRNRILTAVFGGYSGAPKGMP